MFRIPLYVLNVSNPLLSVRNSSVCPKGLGSLCNLYALISKPLMYVLNFRTSHVCHKKENLDLCGWLGVYLKSEQVRMASHLLNNSVDGIFGLKSELKKSLILFQLKYISTFITAISPLFSSDKNKCHKFCKQKLFMQMKHFKTSKNVRFLKFFALMFLKTKTVKK